MLLVVLSLRYLNLYPVFCCICYFNIISSGTSSPRLILLFLFYFYTRFQSGPELLSPRYRPGYSSFRRSNPKRLKPINLNSFPRANYFILAFYSTRRLNGTVTKIFKKINTETLKVKVYILLIYVILNKL